MKKIMIMIMIAMIAIMPFTACGKGDDPAGENTDTIDPAVSSAEDDGLSDQEPPEGFEKIYELSGLEYYDSAGETWVSADFIPGAEKYVFHEDLSCEYVFRDYPTYEDMLSDSNYETVTRNGIYMPVPEENGVSMIIEDFPVSGGMDGDRLIIEHEFNGMPAVRGIYTEVSDREEV